jgi:propanol-preferring alcohol dehydrogenase
MRAYRIVEWQRPPELVETTQPEPGPGQVVVKVAGNGLCHSDGTMSQLPGELGEIIGWRVPFTLGHEIGGWIHALGDGVTGLTEGDPVALVSPESDGTCDYCLRGQDSVCPNGLVGRGYGRDGGLAEYVLVRSTRHVIKLDKLDPVVAGPLTDAGATSYHAVKRVLPRLLPGSTAVVLGAGGLGSFAIQHLRAVSPATVIAVDTSPARRAYATEIGAHHVLDSAGGIRDLTGGEGAEAVLDFVGIDETITAGVEATRPFGAYGVIGAAGGTLKKPWYGGLPRDGEVFNFQGSTISDVREVLALADAGLIRSDVDLFPLDRVKEAYEAMEAGTLRGRAVVTPA